MGVLCKLFCLCFKGDPQTSADSFASKITPLPAGDLRCGCSSLKIPCSKTCLPIFKPRPPSPFHLLFGWITIGIFSSLFIVVPICSILLLALTCVWPGKLWFPAGVVLCLGLYPNKHWPEFTDFFTKHIISVWCELFQFEVICDRDCVLPRDKSVCSKFNVGIHPRTDREFFWMTSACVSIDQIPTPKWSVLGCIDL